MSKAAIKKAPVVDSKAVLVKKIASKVSVLKDSALVAESIYADLAPFLKSNPNVELEASDLENDPEVKALGKEYQSLLEDTIDGVKFHVDPEIVCTLDAFLESGEEMPSIDSLSVQYVGKSKFLKDYLNEDDYIADRVRDLYEGSDLCKLCPQYAALAAKAKAFYAKVDSFCKRRKINKNSFYNTHIYGY